MEIAYETGRRATESIPEKGHTSGNRLLPPLYVAKSSQVRFQLHQSASPSRALKLVPFVGSTDSAKDVVARFGLIDECR